MMRRNRGIYRQHRRGGNLRIARPQSRISRWLAVGVAVAALLIALPIGAAALLHHDHESCTLALADERNSAASSPDLIKERVRNAKAVLQRRSDCDQVVVAAITEAPGTTPLWSGRLRGNGDNELDRDDDARHNRQAAEQQIDQVFGAPPAAAADYLSFFRELSGQLQLMPKTKRVEVWLFASGVDQLWPDLLHAPDLSPQTIEVWLRYVGPITACSHWHVNFVGVNRTINPPDAGLAIGARRWWESLVPTCGGQLNGYGSTVPR